jgi:hypothetical protein
MNGFWERESKLRARDHARDSIRERKQSVHTLLPVDEVYSKMLRTRKGL